MWTVHQNKDGKTVKEILVISSAGTILARSGTLPRTYQQSMIDIVAEATVRQALVNLIQDTNLVLPLIDYYGLLIRFPWDYYHDLGVDALCDEDGVPYVERLRDKSEDHNQLYNGMFQSKVLKEHDLLTTVLEKYGIN